LIWILKEGYKTARDDDSTLDNKEEIVREVRNTQVNGHESQDNSAIEDKTKSLPVLIETIEDKYWEQQGHMPVTTKHLLESDNDLEEENAPRTAAYGSRKAAYHTKEHKPEESETDDVTSHEIPPPTEEEPVRLSKWRKFLSGRSSVGMSVPSVPGWVGSTENCITNLRIDSCANITLISAEFLEELRNKPKILQGEKMKLWQLTKKRTSLLGYVWKPIFIWTSEGRMVETEAEAYIVPEMTMPILLGEDFQQTYELGVSRSVQDGTFLHFGQTEYTAKAERVGRTKDFDYMRKSVTLVNNFI
jgi:hypothetical protein